MPSRRVNDRGLDTTTQEIAMQSQLTLSLDPEEWRPIPGYEGVYEASSHGRIRRLDGVVLVYGLHPRPHKGRILRAAQSRATLYLSVALSLAGKVESIPVHRLVAVAFLGAPQPGKNNVNHIDGTRTNNRAENLEWTSASENGKHAYRIGLQHVSGAALLYGEGSPRSKLTDADVRNIREFAATMSKAELARMFRVKQPTIDNVLRGFTWRHVV
jgi:hypothetical protein